MAALQNKVFLPLAGKPVVVYSLEALQRAQSVGGIVLVAHPNELSYCRTEIVARYKIRHVLGVISGGATRHQSEESALDFLRPRIEGKEGSGIDIVVFHDGARPFVTPDEIDRLVGVARERGGALLGTRLEKWEIIARLRDDGSVGDILPSDELWRAQTPQAFEASALLLAYDQARVAGFEGTDTAATYECLGYPVHMVEGSHDNIKMTTPKDLLRALTLLDNRCV
jgi:2-C-methyl-D-erythritol 4-phosphate cytidylyltransferase